MELLQEGLRQYLSRTLGLGLPFHLRGPHSAKAQAASGRAGVDSARSWPGPPEWAPARGRRGAFYAPIPLCCSSFCC